MTRDPIPELETEIRFLNHFKRICELLIESREERIEELRKHHVASKQRGGYSRAKKLSPERRSEIGRIAASARWKRKENE